MYMSDPTTFLTSFVYHNSITVISQNIHLCIIFRACFAIQGGESVGGKSKRKGYVWSAMDIRRQSKWSGQLLPERMGEAIGSWDKQQKSLFCFHLCHRPVSILSARQSFCSLCVSIFLFTLCLFCQLSCTFSMDRSYRCTLHLQNRSVIMIGMYFTRCYFTINKLLDCLFYPPGLCV